MMGCAFLYVKEWEGKSISPSVSFADSSLVRGSRCGRSIDDSFKAMQKGFSLFLFRYYLDGFGFVRESEAKYAMRRSECIVSTVRANEVMRVLTRGRVILLVVADTTANETQEQRRTPKTYVEPEGFCYFLPTKSKRKGRYIC